MGDAFSVPFILSWFDTMRNLVAMGLFWKGHILEDSGAVSRVWKRGWRKFSRTGERAPGMLLLKDQFHDSSEHFSVIGHKNYNLRSVSIALLS